MTAQYLSVFIFLLFSSMAAGCYADRALHKPPPFKSIKCHDEVFLRVDNICDDERQNLEWAARYPKYKTLASLNRQALKDITRETDNIDLAAAVFYHRAIKDPKNQSLFRFLDRRENRMGRKRPNYSRKKVLLAMVPGMFYKDNPETEADGKSLRELARSIGLTDAVIPIKQDGTVTENAGIICDFLAGDLGDVRSIILASASKGGGDIKLAINRCGHEPFFRRVVGWFNIGGITAGNLLINQLTDSTLYRWNLRSYFCWYGFNWQGFMSARAGKGAPLAVPIQLPKHLLVVSVIGVPFARHVTQRARPYYEASTPEGPSDGIVLLADSYLPGGIVYPSFRNDHYFQWIIPAKRMMAMLAFIIETKT